MSKLLLPIVTPYVGGHFDERSLNRVVHKANDSADVFIPCLSSGEGGKLSGEAWKRVVQTVRSATEKPVFAGILGKEDLVEEYMNVTREIGCEGVVLPLGAYEPQCVKAIVEIVAAYELKIIFYNTESALVKDVEYITSLAANDNVVGFKDSSMDDAFVRRLKAALGDDCEVYQGMEMAMKPEQVVDGFCISLANVEPALCARLAGGGSREDWGRLEECIAKYNLESEQWYVYVKKALSDSGVIRSKELIQ